MSGSYKTEQRKSTLASVISDAFSELQGLGEEARELFDNMPESLQSSSRAEAFSNSADVLESISEPDVPECCTDLEVSYGESVVARKRMSISRARRLGNATAMLDAAREAADTHAILLREKATDARDDEESDASDEAKEAVAEKLEQSADECDELVSELESAISEAEGCEFPGMFG